jgi:hypothetical protein
MTRLRLVLRRLPAASVTILLLPIIAREYFQRETGRLYGLTLGRKLVLLVTMVRNNVRIESASNFISHLLMAAKIMNVPPDAPGVLVECGCFKGGSTANLSLVAAACGRVLHVFDSFAGLPTPDEVDGSHIVLADMEIQTYEKGAYFGALDEVRENVRRYGELDACEFHVGFFEDTLPTFHEPVVFAFLDVDLVSSEASCLRYLWPLLTDGCRVFTDEAHHHAIAQLFYDPQWWQQELGTAPPGLVGAGSGLGLMIQAGGFHSSLGYTVKIDDPDSVLERRPG